MARKYFTPIDLNGLEIQNVKFQNLATAPTPQGVGHVYYNTANDTLYIYDGSNWMPTGKIQADVFTSRPLAGSVGRFFFATDTQILYYDNGSVWQQISNFGSPVALDGSTNVDGTSNSYARADHKHAHGNTEHAHVTLDAFSAAAANISIGNYRVTNVADPVDPQDAATKNYVDLAVQGIDWKQSVKAATTANITLSGTQTVDGYELQVGDRILVKNQTTASENGVYVVAAGSWQRSVDANTSAKVTSGFAVFVEHGTTNGDQGWVLVTDGVITLGTTDLEFVQFTGLGQIEAGAGLTKTGNTMDAVAGLGITVNANDIAIDTTVTARKVVFSSFTITVSGSAVTETLTHNLGNRDVQVAVYDATTYADIECDISRTDTNSVLLTFYKSGTFRAVIVG